jgi:SAM-dependent methyltransferase
MPQMSLDEMVNGARYTQLLYVAAKLGIADLLKNGPRSPDDLAQSIGANRRNLYRVLRALASLGVFAENRDGKFELTAKAEPLQSDVPGSLRATAIIYGEEWLYRPWGGLLDNVKADKPAFDRIFHMGFWEYLASNPEAGKAFDQAMTSRSARELTAVLSAYDFSSISKIVDVGGGQGQLISAILKANPDMRGILFDLPSVIEGSRGLLESEGVRDRCELVGGSFFESVPAGGDAYILQAVLHNWNDSNATVILQNCRRAMGDNGRLLIVDNVLSTGNESSPSKITNINMMVTLGALERTESEFRALLDAAGFRLTKVIPTQARSIIEGEPV